MIGAFPVATEPLVRSPGPNTAPALFVQIAEEPDGDAQFLVEIDAYVGGTQSSGGIAGIAEIPLAAHPPGGGVDTGLITLRYSDKHWVGAPDDSRFPNTYYEGRVSVPLLVDRLMPVLPEESRRVQRQYGEIEIVNADGDLDSIVRNYAVDGRKVRVLLGPLMGAYTDYGEIVNLVATGWSGESDRVRIGLRDRSYNLDTPLQENLYAGTGGAEGTAEIEGKAKPLTYGRVRNITPILIDPNNLIFQWHDGTVSAVDDIFDRGAALTSSGVNVASYAALVSESVASGEYATANAVGMFKLGGLPDGLITMDGRGDATPTYANTLDVIALRILLVKHGLSSAFVDTGGFAGAAAIAGELGLYIHPEDRPSTADVLDRLLSSVGGWWGATRNGKITAGRLTSPEDRTPNLFLDQYDIIELTSVPILPPRWRQRVAYKPNWTTQRGEDLASSVTAERRQFLVEEQRVVSYTNESVRTRHLQALDEPPLQSLYESESDAQTLANTLGALHSKDRRMFDIRLGRKGFLRDLQAVVQITWPRFGLQNGQNFAIVGIRDEAYNTLLRVWG